MPDPSPIHVSDARLDLCVEAGDGQVSVTLRDRQTGTSWGPVPLVQMELYQRSEQRIETYQRFRVDALEAVDGGAHVVIAVAERKVQVGLWLRLVDGELSVMMSPNELYERWSDYARLYALQILPGLCEVGPDGTLVLPFGEGMICHPRGKEPMQDRGLIYMEQSRWELGVLLPVIAAQDERGGLVMLQRQCAADGEWHVQITRENRGIVGMGFSYRRQWVDPVDATNRELRIVPIAADVDPVLATAKRLRRHIIDDLGKKTLRERAQEAPDLAYLTEAFAFKPFFGIENEGLICAKWDKSDPQTFKNCMTFQELEGVLAKLKAAGVEKVYNQLVGWNVRGHDGLYPTRFPIEERVGGEAGLKSLIAKHRELGYLVTFHDNFMMNIPHAPDFDIDCVAWDVYGQPLLSGWWSGGLEYFGWASAYPYERLEGYMRRVQETFQLNGPYYADYMCRPLEVNYHPKHKGTRRDCAASQCLVMETANTVFGSSATEYGALPIAIAADYISGAGCRARHRGWPIAKLMEQEAQIWQLALSGLLIRERPMHPGWERTRHSVAFARIPRDEWSIRAKPMPAITDTRIAQIAAVYDVACRRFGYLRWEEMTAFETLSDTAYCSEFADGTQVTVDDADGLLQVNGEVIPCPAALRDMP